MKEDGPSLRKVMRHWTSGVALVTVLFDNQAHGMTVSSFTSISLEPPLILAALEKSSRTHQLLTESGRFAVAMLAHDQREVADRFAGRISDQGNRFEDIEVRKTAHGIPFPKGSLAVLECDLEDCYHAGTHTIMIGAVKSSLEMRTSTPLVYYNQEYRKLDDRRDDR
jgi:flavin reductase (DIM6/NTAB) family NADH-FMN oxidoreductase RutF